MPPQELTDDDREAAKLLRRMLAAQAKLDAQSAGQVPQGFELVQETADGGKIYRKPNGQLTFTSPDYATSDQAEIQRMMQGEAPGAARRGATQQELIAQNPVGTRAMSAIKGLPGVGEYFDEAVGMMTSDPRYTQAMRETQAAMQEQKPVETFGLQAAFGTAATLPLVPLQAAGRAMQAAPTLGRAMLGALGVGAGAGAVEGGVSGFGAAEGTAEERMGGAGTGAIIGGMLGGALGALAAPVEVGVRNTLQAFANKPIKDFAKQFGISKDAAKVIIASIQDGDFPTAQAALQRAGSSSMLAEMTPNTKNLLDAAITFGSGGNAAQQALLARNLRGEQEMRTAFNRFLGNPADIKDVQGNIRMGTAQQRRQLYDAAYNSPINYSTLAGRELQNWQKLIPPEALNFANKIRSMDPEARAPQILFKQNPDGTITFDELPNVEQWDLITRGLNEMAYGSPGGVMGGKSEVQRLAANASREIRKLVMDQVPEYRAALGLARDTIEEVKAAEIGFDLLSGSTTVKEVKDLLAGQSPAARQSMKLGLRSGLDHTLGNLKVSAANPNTEIKELMAGLSALRSRNNKVKVRALLGDADAEEFYKVLDEQATGIELAHAVAINSKTAQRFGVERTVEEVRGAGGIYDALKKGEPVNFSKRVWQSITGATPEAEAIRRMGLYDDLATLLTRVQGQQAKDALNLIQQARAGRALSHDQAWVVAKAVTTPAAIGAYSAISSGQRQSMIKPRREREATE